jgi:ferritin-like metal-binding protein YciE
MVRDRTLKKVNKVLLRVEKHIEETRDALEDLEIEFEVLKATVKRKRFLRKRLWKKSISKTPQSSGNSERQSARTSSRFAHIPNQCSRLASKPGG